MAIANENNNVYINVEKRKWKYVFHNEMKSI